MEDLAQFAGLSLMTVWRIETGKVNRSYRHTMASLAKALKCELNELLQVVKQAAPPDEIKPEEADPSPEDLEELPDLATLPPEPLLPYTIEHLCLSYRAQAGKRFTYVTQVRDPQPLHVQERVAIKCIPADVALCFETNLLTDTTATRVPVYSNQEHLTRALRRAADTGRMMRLVVKVLVVENISKSGTIADGIEAPPEAFKKWKGFSWPAPEPRQMWCLLATEATRWALDSTWPDGGYKGGGF